MLNNYPTTLPELQFTAEHLDKLVDLIVNDVVDLGVDSSGQALLACELINCYNITVSFLPY